MIKKKLIVGANSFIASKLVSILEGELVALINVSDDRIDYKKYKRVYSSFSELSKNEKNFDTIFHIASFIPYSKFNSPNKQFVINNIDLVSQISTNYSKSKIIFFSSVAVYGSNDDFPITIHSCFKQPSLYGLSKIAGEAIIKNHQKYAILRISSIWGKGIETDTFIPRLINQAKDRKKIVLYGRGLREQNYIHWSDLIQIAKKSEFLKENSVLLAVEKKNFSNYFLAKKIATKLKVQIDFIDLPESQSMIFNADETYKLINYTPIKSSGKDILELI